jgi:hypothetical protein
MVCVVRARRDLLLCAVAFSGAVLLPVYQMILIASDLAGGVREYAPTHRARDSGGRGIRVAAYSAGGAGIGCGPAVSGCLDGTQPPVLAPDGWNGALDLPQYGEHGRGERVAHSRKQAADEARRRSFSGKWI